MIKLFTSDGKFSFLKVGAQLVVLSALVLGLVAFVGNNKTVTLNVDGTVTSLQTFGGTVGQVVRSADVDLASDDMVSPAEDTAVENGQIINVNRAKDVTVNLDGAESTVSTTAPDVGGLVTELGVASTSLISVPTDAQLTVAGSFVAISTPKTISVVADGAVETTTTTARTVDAVLTDAGITLGVNDRLSQPIDAPVVDNMILKVSRVDTTQTAATTEDIPFETLKTDSAEILKGEEEVTQVGSTGTVEKTFKLVTVDGREASRTLVAETVSVQPVTEQILVGTKVKPVEVPKTAAAAKSAGSGNGGGNTGAAAPAAANEGMWDRIAQCESTGNWSINNGNGYYGGLQFDIQTWLSSGGGAYAPNASLATKAQQIDIANRVYAQRGLQPWGCASAAG